MAMVVVMAVVEGALPSLRLQWRQSWIDGWMNDVGEIRPINAALLLHRTATLSGRLADRCSLLFALSLFLDSRQVEEAVTNRAEIEMCHR